MVDGENSGETRDMKRIEGGRKAKAERKKQQHQKGGAVDQPRGRSQADWRRGGAAGATGRKPRLPLFPLFSTFSFLLGRLLLVLCGLPFLVHLPVCWSAVRIHFPFHYPTSAVFILIRLVDHCRIYWYSPFSYLEAISLLSF